jgi:uncharacterized protein YjbI with pentapeptide repeats
MKNKKSALASLVLAFLLGVSVMSFSRVFAQDGDTNLIHACVNGSGNLRIIGPTDTCRNNETPLNWRIQGEPGTSGNGIPYFICPGCELQDSGDRLTGRDLTKAFLPGSSVHGVDLNSTLLDNADLIGSDMREAILTDASLTNADMTRSAFAEADLTNANLSGANLTGVTFTDYGWELGPADLTNTDLTNANLTDANLVDVNLASAILTGVTWSNTICPDGTNSNNNGNTCSGHLIP